MNLPGCLLAAVTLLMAAPAAVNPEKLSVLLPNQNAQFDLDHEPELDPRDSGVSAGLSPPLGLPVPSISQLPLAAPPAPLPTGPPAFPDSRTNLDRGINLEDRVPLVSGLYELPEAGSDSSVGTCEAQTVVVTSRDVVVSTVVSQVRIPTTVLQEYTTTQLQVQTERQTSYITLPPVIQTRTVTTVVPQTVYRTTTRIQQQVVTTTQFRVQTQLVTSRYTDYVTTTETSYVYQTVYRTQVQPTYITTTLTVIATPSCPSYDAPTTVGYDYTAPANTAPAYTSGPSGGYGTFKGPVYGPYYHASYYQPQTRRKRVFSGRKFFG